MDAQRRQRRVGSRCINYQVDFRKQGRPAMETETNLSLSLSLNLESQLNSTTTLVR